MYATTSCAVWVPDEGVNTKGESPMKKTNRNDKMKKLAATPVAQTDLARSLMLKALEEVSPEELELVRGGRMRA